MRCHLPAGNQRHGRTPKKAGRGWRRDWRRQGMPTSTVYNQRIVEASQETMPQAEREVRSGEKKRRVDAREDERMGGQEGGAPAAGEQSSQHGKPAREENGQDERRKGICRRGERMQTGTNNEQGQETTKGRMGKAMRRSPRGIAERTPWKSLGCRALSATSGTQQTESHKRGEWCKPCE